MEFSSSLMIRLLETGPPVCVCMCVCASMRNTHWLTVSPATLCLLLLLSLNHRRNSPRVSALQTTQSLRTTISILIGQ